MVRRDPDNLEEYIAIDGHNLIAVKDLLKESIEVYVAEHEDDFIFGEGEAIEKRNKDLKDKFNFALSENRRIEKEGVLDFSSLKKSMSI